MSRYRRNDTGFRPERLERVRRYFAAAYGDEARATRAAIIARLDHKLWHGRPVFRLICQADFGKGPHDLWVPEGLLWALIDIRHYHCPFH
jgi:hypothetical protein